MEWAIWCIKWRVCLTRLEGHNQRLGFIASGILMHERMVFGIIPWKSGFKISIWKCRCLVTNDVLPNRNAGSR